jgi:hypothetical protein
MQLVYSGAFINDLNADYSAFIFFLPDEHAAKIQQGHQA